ncbi:BTB/POZ domain-containing protein 2-like [Nilaparvata lugens]|uniref:BTB/POZ domain-containing protein 2-like n=1 Tax=Nilaparvata lugens TaxID=108931 RepID=UPI00193DA519|nr:BTB/POZ domain-containing protein 2-like [Nilaparvata lugens]XP_039285149.1 BTB/POZ domain-containing protein 2-like [Nilaparvata lugens]
MPSSNAGECSSMNNSYECGGGDGYEERFTRLFNGSIENDCEFIVGPQKTSIKGHKLLFSMASEVFHAMFYSQLRESSTIVIDDLDVSGFQGMKHFIYTGNVDFTSALQACSTFVAARKYLITQLKEKSIEFILKQNISPLEVLELYEFCKYNNVSEIEQKCIQSIQEETEDVVRSKYFLLVDAHTMVAILKLHSLHLQSELEIFNHFERWAIAEADRLNLSKDKIASHFNCLLKHIRFLAMSCEEFASGPAKSNLLTQGEKLAISLNLMDFGSATYPENFSLIQQERVFKSPDVEEKKFKHTFLVSLDKKQEMLEVDFDFGEVKWIVSQRIFKESLYFQVQPENLENEDFLIRSRIKLRVLSRMKKYDDLCFENECFTIYNEETESASGNKFGISSPVIPLKKLKNLRYMEDNKVIIEGTFLLESIDNTGAEINEPNVNQ